MKSKKNNAGLAVFILIIVIVVLLSAFEIVANIFFPQEEKTSSFGLPENIVTNPFNLSSKNKKANEKVKINSKDNYIAKLYITGVIQEENESYNQKWILNAIDTLIEDKKNVGMILFINSPGGGVYETDEVYYKLLEYKKVKPLYAYLANIAASGGYYMACAADYIMANRNSLVGSIGVISGQSLDLTGLFEKHGIKSETIHAGANKNMGNYNEPLTSEQREILQSLADETYDQFVAVVSEGRNMTTSDVKKVADGRIYSAKQAMDNGLIDAVGSWDDCLSKMRSKEFEFEEYEALDVQYEYDPGLPSWLWGMSKNFSPKAQLLPESIEKKVLPNIPYPAYYYELYN